MKIKLIVIVVLIVAAVLALFVITGSEAGRQRDYEEALAYARSYSEREIPYMAVQWYLSALSMKVDDEVVYKEYLQQATLLGNPYYKDAVEDYPTRFPSSPEAYEVLCEYQYGIENYTRAVETALTAGRLGIATERVKEIYYDSYYQYRYIRTGLEEADRFIGGKARVKQDGRYGIIDSNGHYVFSPQFVDIAPMVDSTAAVEDETEWYMINSEGYKIARPSEAVDYMSYLSGGWVLVGKDGRYSYMQRSLTVPESLPYEAASNFRSGIAAVKQNGKWGLISNSGEHITDFIYDDILLDDFGTCIASGVVFAKQSGKYYMLNAQGERIGDASFDDAYPFSGDDAGPAAVCVSGKWGFVDDSGATVIEPKYENARSFCLDLAPVCIDGVWGYINSKGILRIEPEFSDAMPFSANGTAAVKENEVWSYIRLQAFNDD